MNREQSLSGGSTKELGQSKKAKWRWLQFSLRTAIIGMFVLSMLLGYGIYWYRQKRMEEFNRQVNSERIALENMTMNVNSWYKPSMAKRNTFLFQDHWYTKDEPGYWVNKFAVMRHFDNDGVVTTELVAEIQLTFDARQGQLLPVLLSNIDGAESTEFLEAFCQRLDNAGIPYRTK